MDFRETEFPLLLNSIRQENEDDESWKVYNLNILRQYLDLLNVLPCILL